MNICKECKHYVPPTGMLEVEGREWHSAECAVSTYMEYVTGAVFKYYCRVQNSDGKCRKFEKREAQNG